MPEINSLDDGSLRELAHVIRVIRHQLRDLQEQQARQNRESAPPIAYVCKTTSGITAMASSVPGVGTADIYIRKGSNTTPTSGGTLTNTNLEITVFNMTPNEVATDTWIMVKRDAYGDYWVDLEACA